MGWFLKPNTPLYHEDVMTGKIKVPTSIYQHFQEKREREKETAYKINDYTKVCLYA
jgi:hypothetical protein